MAKIIDIGTVFSKIYRDIERQDNNNPPEEKRRQVRLAALLYMALIGTMAPVHIAVTFFSFVAILTAAIYSVLAFTGHAQLRKRTYALTTALTTISILSGCSPLLHTTMTPEMVTLINERDYRYHSMYKLGMFGLGLDEVTIENTQFEGDIETVYVAKIEHGYGIVSLSRVTVAGK